MICIFGKGAVSLSKIGRGREGTIFLPDEMGGMKENLFLSTALSFVDYRELIGGFFDLTTHLNCYMRFIFDITIQTSC